MNLGSQPCFLINTRCYSELKCIIDVMHELYINYIRLDYECCKFFQAAAIS